jgi:hypothetical protein
MGGLERIKSVRSARCTADIWLNGLDARGTWVEKWPTFSLIEIQWPNGKSRLASSGPARAADRAEELNLPAEQIFGDLVAYALDTGSGSKVEYLGQLDEEGVSAQVIALRKLDGRSTTYYLDPTTSLPFKFVFKDAKKATTTTVYVGGWYREGGIAFHRRMDYCRNGQMFESNSKTQCVLNPAIDDAVFAKEPTK